MTLLNPDAETRFEKLLEDLPEETAQLARQFKAFTRARKIKTPAQLMRVVLLYCGLDQSLREVAATMTLLEERITDQAVLERLAVCGPWLKAVLEQMLPAVPTVPRRFRVLLIDGSTVEGPGAKGTNYRLHLCFDLVAMTFTEILITDKHTGESLKHFTLQAGDLAIADRGFCHPRPMMGFLAQRPQSVHSTGKNPQTDNLKRFSSLAAEHMSTVFAFNAFQTPWPSSLPFLSTYFLSKSLFLTPLRAF